MMRLLKRLWPEEEGQGLSEYALLLFLVSLTAVTAMGGLATRLSTAYTSTSTHVAAASQGPSLSGTALGNGSQTPSSTPSPFENGNNPYRDQAGMPH